MKNVLILLLICLFSGLSGYTQVHQITFNHTPPPIPVVDAGPDTTIGFWTGYTLPATVTSGTAPFTYLWQPGKLTSDSTILNPTCVPDPNGGFTAVLTLTVTDSNGCVASDQVTITTYINSINEATLYVPRIYPNPSEGKIRIWGLPATTENTVVECYSLAGSLIRSETVYQSEGTLEVDLRKVVPGFYWLSIDHNGHRYMQKIIIQ